MYDDSAVHVMRGHHQGHWYDEPPYESDPDDFLMTGIHRNGPAAMIQVKPQLISSPIGHTSPNHKTEALKNQIFT
jgi:hypothetical protein